MPDDGIYLTSKPVSSIIIIIIIIMANEFEFIDWQKVISIHPFKIRAHFR